MLCISINLINCCQTVQHNHCERLCDSICVNSDQLCPACMQEDCKEVLCLLRLMLAIICFFEEVAIMT